MMDAARRPGIRSRRPKRTVQRDLFVRLVLSLPQVPRKATRGQAGPLALLLLGGFGLGAWWPRDPEASRPAGREEIFVFEEDAVQTLPPLEVPSPAPQPTAPSPPKDEAPEVEEAEEKPPPKPQPELEEPDLSGAGDLALARENTLDKEAEEVEVSAPAPSAPVLLDRQPGILMGAPPEYPPRALERGLEGTVVALVTIDTNGRVTEARIEQGAGRVFDGPVLDAVRRLRFQPLIREGRRWPARFRIPYEFRLE